MNVLRKILAWLLPSHPGGRIAVVLAAFAMIAFLVVARKFDSGKSAQRVAAAHEKGQTAHWTHYVNVWTPRAAAANTALCAVLVAGGRWFFRRRPDGALPVPSKPDKRATAALIITTAAAVLYTGIANAPRLEFGLWADEESTMRKSVVGEYERGEDGRMVLRPVNWGDTVFRYTDPNNHIFHSVLARISHTLFARPLNDPGDWYFDGRAMRYPVFVCGLGMFAALAWIAYLVRMPLAGCAAAVLLAFHPWCAQLMTEARGYGIAFLLVPLAVALAIRSLQTGGWVTWIACGLTQFLILWTWPAALHLLLVLNGAIFFSILRSPPGWRSVQFARWGVAGVIALLPALHLLLPVAQPLMNYLSHDRMQGELMWHWYPDAAALMLTGQPWHQWSASPLHRTWEYALEMHPVLAGCGLAAALVLLFTGIVACWRKGGGARVLLAVPLLHAPLQVLHAHLMGNFLYYVYVALSTPLLVLVAGAGAGAIAEWRKGQAGSAAAKFAGPVLAVLCIGVLLTSTAEWRGIVRSNATEPYAAAAAATRTVRNPASPDYDRDVITFAPAMATRGYDPGGIEFYVSDRDFPAHLAAWKKAGLCPADMQPASLDDAGSFAALAQHAAASGRKFLVHFGSPGFTAGVCPDIWKLLHDERCFVREVIWHGLDIHPTSRTREVYRYTGDAAALKAALAALPQTAASAPPAP